MKQIFSPIFFALFFYAVSVPERTVFHKTNTVPSEWVNIGIPSPNTLLDFTIMIHQKNLDVLESVLVNTVDPNSVYYGQWLSKETIDTIVYGSDKNFTAIYKWLEHSHITRESCENTSDSIRCKTSIKNIETAFRTEIMEYQNKNTNKIWYSGRETGYSVPFRVRTAVEFVWGIVDFPQLKPKKSFVKKPRHNEGYIAPESIRSLYNIPGKLLNSKLSSQSVVEFQDDTCFNMDDLDQFIKDNNLKQVHFKSENVWGPCNFTTSGPDIEATLDIQYQIGTNQDSVQYYVTVSDWLYQYASQMYNSTNPPMVSSMSYGWAEWDQCDPTVFPECFIGGDSTVYAQRTNTEFMKLGLRGVTLLASSGDAGSPGRMSEDCEPNKPLNPAFPTSSPWVLSVGGNIVENFTVHNDSSAPLCQKNVCIDRGLEINCDYNRCGWTSGGGFSNYFNRPSWQAELVDTYLKSSATFPPQQFFNKNGRAYPDISLVAHNYLIRNSGQYTTVDGTSASSPVMSGMVSILNNLRVSQNKPVLGPVAPLLYDMYKKCPDCFTDLVTGSNNSTETENCKYGYFASKGYDAVYGLGTPDFGNIYNYIKNMEN